MEAKGWIYKREMNQNRQKTRYIHSHELLTAGEGSWNSGIRKFEPTPHPPKVYVREPGKLPSYRTGSGSAVSWIRPKGAKIRLCYAVCLSLIGISPFWGPHTPHTVRNKVKTVQKVMI